MKWLNQWRLRRAERALTRAVREREERDLANPEYGGLSVEQVDEEVRIHRRVADLRQRLERGEAQSKPISASVDRIRPQD